MLLFRGKKYLTFHNIHYHSGRAPPPAVPLRSSFIAEKHDISPVKNGINLHKTP